MGVLDSLRGRLQNAVLEPFSHGSNPLEHTLEYAGDPGLFGPDSVTWPLMGDVAAMFGGVRALLIQFAHPEVAAGMDDHSAYERDHLGRISRTTDYVAATSFGAIPEVEAAIGAVRRAHRVVVGESHRGVSYTADDDDLASWVHNALSESFLASYQAFGPRRLSPGDADRFAAEQVRLGEAIGADHVPTTADELRRWIADHPRAGRSPGATKVVPFIAAPPSRPAMLLGYKILFWGACATVPRRLRRILGVRRYPGAILAGRALASVLRWAMGWSPAWMAALIRVEAPMPENVRFRQPLPNGQYVA